MKEPFDGLNFLFFLLAFYFLLIISGEIETVFDERGARKGIVADAIATNPRIQNWQRKQKEKKKQKLRFAREPRTRRAKDWLIHERSTRRKSSLFRAAIITGQRHEVEPVSREQGRNLVAARNLGGIVPHDFTWESNIRNLKPVCSNRLSLEADRVSTIVVGTEFRQFVQSHSAVN